METKTENEIPESRIASDDRPPQLKDSNPSETQMPGSNEPQNLQANAWSHERRGKIAEAAYYRAEQRGFAPGNEDADWLEAENEIDGTYIAYL